jgi:DNA-binding IclR family transcriptional regulator
VRVAADGHGCSTRYDARVSESSELPRGPQNHRTVDRVTHIVEEVTYNPGLTFAELARAVGAPKSSVHGFVRGLLANGWLYEVDRRSYLGPALRGLSLANGQLRAGAVSQSDLDALHKAANATVFLGMQAGDHLIYVGVSGTDELTGFAARSNIRRDLLTTAGGRALLAQAPDRERDAYLRRRNADSPELVSQFLSDLREIRETGVAENVRHDGAQFAMAAVVRNQFGELAGEITLVGRSDDLVPRKAKLRKVLLDHVGRLAATR